MDALSESYFGGKGNLWRWLINMIPRHNLYVEAFLGHGALMRNLAPAQASIGIESNPDVLARWTGQERPGLTFLEGDALDILPGLAWEPGAFLYCDPPYLRHTRRDPRARYAHEFDQPAQHLRLLEILRSLPCAVMVSGYAAPLYFEILGDWRVESTRAQTRGGPSIEYVWMNYPAPDTLHDYRYLGDDFRARERRKRQENRWRARFQKMPAHERQAMWRVLQDVISATGESQTISPESHITDTQEE